jgi:hypothetical protein
MLSKKKSQRDLIRKDQELTQQILAHPVVREMATQLSTVKRMLEELPKLIGEAVAEATRRPPEGASGPPVPRIDVGSVEIHRHGLKVDGKEFTNDQMKKKEHEREISKGPRVTSVGAKPLVEEGNSIKL